MKLWETNFAGVPNKNTHSRTSSSVLLSFLFILISSIIPPPLIIYIKGQIKTNMKTVGIK